MRPLYPALWILSTATALLWTQACRTNPVSSRQTPIVRVVEAYAPAVVNIRTEKVVDLKATKKGGTEEDDPGPLPQDYYGETYANGTLIYKSVGSGVILDPDGLIVTNAHVVQKATKIYVVLIDGTLLQAEVVGMNEMDDLAIIRADLPRPVRQVRLADTGDVMIGETVIAIGNPFGLENSVTVGVLSGKDRTLSKPQCAYACSGLLQTDAPINPGNSGGALLNLDGELIGINLAVVQSAENIGFAVPADKVRELLRIYK